MAKDDDKGRGHQGPGWWPDEGGTPRGGQHRPTGGRRQSGRGGCADWILGVMLLGVLTAAAAMGWLW